MSQENEQTDKIDFNINQPILNELSKNDIFGTPKNDFSMLSKQNESEDSETSDKILKNEENGKNDGEILKSIIDEINEKNDKVFLKEKSDIEQNTKKRNVKN